MQAENDFLSATERRGLLAQVNHLDELRDHLETAPRTAYVGIDPTGPSMHVGHLLPVMQLARWIRSGHKGIALLGGGTARIGDPTGKTDMRKILGLEEISHNKSSIAQQVRSFCEVQNSATLVLVDNSSWLDPLNYLDFLQEYGRHFSVNRMLTADCFKSRLETGLSFLEFNYMLLQAYDFLHLFKTHNCTVQLGGDDQWSNMLAGADLIRRTQNREAYCLTFPLLTRPDGKKMGKTEKGAVWLDAKLTPPFEYYQFWRNQADEMIGQLLSYFTFLSSEEIEELSREALENPNSVKERLALEVTTLAHGEEEARKAQEGARSLFGGGGVGSAGLPECDLKNLQWDKAEIEISELLMHAKITATKSEGRRLIQQGGLVWDGLKIDNEKATFSENDAKSKSQIVVRKGKKNAYLILFS